MKISLKWLQDLFPSYEKNGGLAAHSAEFREKLPLAGLEIGSWKRMGQGIDDVIVGQILEFQKHPKADRLNVCRVSQGEGKEILQVVCGAPNVKAKMKVALARVGTVLPGDFKIKEARIRDVDSYGMLCSERELGLSEAGEGILELPDSAPLGSGLVKALGINDEIWEIELTPDRGDCLSHWGIAREIGRMIGQKPVLPEHDPINPKDSGEVPMLSVEVQAPKVCPIYGAQLFEGLANGDSPEWMRRRLESLGTRTHNAVVDITNFVLSELGHPMHAFDADKIRGSKIIVRFAKAGEKLKTLDGVDRVLTAQDLVIADLEAPLALAGVMGGFDSGVTKATTRVVLETAVFDHELIRSMAQRHKIHSDSSHRFERGVDAANRLNAAGRATLLIRQLTRARKRGSYIEVSTEKAEKLLAPQSHNFDLRAFKDVVGLEASAEEITKCFLSVSVEAQIKSPNVLKVEVPTHRHDLVREIDLVEEAARLLGYDRIPLRYPQQHVFTVSSTRTLFQRLRQLRHRWVETGLSEMMPYDFISGKEAAHLRNFNFVEIKNPLSAEWQYMRPNLSFGLIGVMARHAALGQLTGGFFDTGNVFETVKDSEDAARDSAKGDAPKAESAKSEAVPTASHSTGTREAWHAGFALIGSRRNDHWSSDKKSSERKAEVDFFDGKGVVEQALDGLMAVEARWGGAQFVALSEFLKNENFAQELAGQAPWIPVDVLHPGRSALIVWPGKPQGSIVGYVGELHPSLKPDLLNLPKGLQLGAVMGELRVVADIGQSIELTRKGQLERMSPRDCIEVSRRLPIVERDLALVVDPAVRAVDLDKTLRRAAGAELIDLQCLDLFKLPDGKNSLAFKVLLQGQDATLTDEQITGVVKKMLQAAGEKHQAVLRS